MSSDDRGPLVLTPDMLQSHMRLVDVADLNDWAGPYEGNVGAAHTHLGAFGQLQVPVVVDGEVLFGQEYVAAERFDAQYGGQLNVLDLTDLDWPREKVVAAVLGLHNLERQASVDAAQLLDLLQEVQKADEAWLQGAGYDGDDLEAIYEQLQRDQEALGGSGNTIDDPDDVPDTAPAITKLGDVWIIGPHRVVCGDASDGTVLDAALDGQRPGMVLADPPYGMNLQTDYSAIGRGTAKGGVVKGKRYRAVEGDDRPFDAALWIEAFDDVDEQFWWGADYYRRTIPLGGGWLAWDKRVEGLEDAVGNAFELCWSRQPHKRLLFRYLWSGFTARERGEPRSHPTQKPVALMAEMIQLWAPPDAIILDPFGGSGTTLVAAHQEGRAARLVELDLRYVDVICKRAQLATGLMPILESTGEAHDFTEGD